MNMQDAQKRNIQARITQINQAIQSLQRTIDAVSGAREMPGVSVETFKAQIEKLVAEKVELTGAMDVADAVVNADEHVDKPVSENEERKRTDASQSRPAFEKPGKKWKEYKYEELFHENIDGDLILTFPDEVLKESGWKEGDVLDMEVIHGNLHIRKRVDINK